MMKAIPTFSENRKAAFIFAAFALTVAGSALENAAQGSSSEMNREPATESQPSGAGKIVIRDELEEIDRNNQSKEVIFQNGMRVVEPDFIGAPRCYLRLKKPLQKTFSKNPGGKTGASSRNADQSSGELSTLTVIHLENQFRAGQAYAVIQFSPSDPVSAIACYMSAEHSMTAQDIQSALGKSFQIEFSTEQKAALAQNIAPPKAEFRVTAEARLRVQEGQRKLWAEFQQQEALKKKKSGNASRRTQSQDIN